MPTPFPGQTQKIFLELKHLEVLASVAATEVFGAVPFDQPISIREIAVEVERSPASVGIKVADLVSCGLVMIVGTQKRRSRTETLYARTAEDIAIVYTTQPQECLDAYFQRFRGLMNLAVRQHEAYWKAVQIEPELAVFGRFVRETVWLSPKNSALVKKKINELSALAMSLSETDPEKRRGLEVARLHFSVMLFPTVRQSQDWILNEGHPTLTKKKSRTPNSSDT